MPSVFLPMRLTACIMGALLVRGGWAADEAPPAANEQHVAYFQQQVLPLLKQHCFECHGGKEVKGGLRLSSRAGILRGGDLGPAVELEDRAESTLLAAINYDGLEMPPAGKLPPEKIAVLTRWVTLGIPWTPGGAEELPEKDHGPLQVTAEDRNYWAYRPVRKPPLPEIRNASWIRNAIDTFILSHLEAAGLQPVSEADRRTLIRRATYDLHGLPPSPAEVDRFLADESPDAYERLIDRLLASPRYGEKWGRHWLDLVRYAETHGYERDSPKPAAWRYRDYVIEAFNRDKPYDRFVQQQLAGDELADADVDSLIATGYYRLGLWDDEPADPLQARYDVLDDVVKTTAEVVLGTTLGCARCHDHKKDPLPQRDYYRMLAFFDDLTDMRKDNTRRVATDQQRAEHRQQVAAKEAREAQWYGEIYGLEQRLNQALADAGEAELVAPGSDLAELHYRFYRDTWERLPGFDGLKPETTGEVAEGFFSLRPASRPHAIGLVFEGRLKVPQPGEYRFLVEATGGVRLSVDGNQVVAAERAGKHRIEAPAKLRAGLVPVRLEYFNAYEKPALHVTWSGPDFRQRPLSRDGLGRQPSALLADSRRQPQQWSYVTSQPGADWMKPEFDDGSWKSAPGGFGRKGTPGSVVRTAWHRSDIWLRRRFDLEQIPKAVTLAIHHDEDAEVYLNGRLVNRRTGYLTEYRNIALEDAAAAALRKGPNLLAIHCRNSGGGQYIDAGLLAGPGPLDRATLMKRFGVELLGGEAVERYFRLVDELASSRKTQLPEPGIPVMCVAEQGSRETHVLIRGNAHLKGDRVSPGFPAVLDPAGTVIEPKRSGRTGGKRRVLARWLTSEDNPLTARVIVNRLWQHHFGRGIVPTPNDFGLLGEPPTHPRLLNWLAAELMRRDWSLKSLHRLMMTSSAYRMSSRAEPGALAQDPDNLLFWRFNMRRLTAEEIRDSILDVSGALNLKMGGPSVYPEIPPGVLAGQSRPGQGWGDSPPAERNRRSIYAHVKRSLLLPVLENFDLADTDSSCPVRYSTTVPTQALGMLNGQFAHRQAKVFAARLAAEHPGDLEARVRRAIRLTTGRAPADDEAKRDRALIRDLEADGHSPAEALTFYCLMLINTNEFLNLD